LIASGRKAGPGHTFLQATAVSTAPWVKEDRDARLKYLESSALSALGHAVEELQAPVFPCALIAGDVVILHLLHRLGYLSRVQVVFIDTFHLFEETHTFLKQLEGLFGFKALTYQAQGFASKEEYRKQYGSDLFMTDVEKYDYICKVEPFQRALKELGAGVMINGRRRDHGAERAHLEVFEEGKGPVGCQPLAYWEFRDCFDYLARHNVPHHPLHDQGYPSVGDLHSTVPVPRDKWWEYGAERSGRFQGMKNSDGSTKTECGIHNRR